MSDEKVQPKICKHDDDIATLKAVQNAQGLDIESIRRKSDKAYNSVHTSDNDTPSLFEQVRANTKDLKQIMKLLWIVIGAIVSLIVKTVWSLVEGR